MLHVATCCYVLLLVAAWSLSPGGEGLVQQVGGLCTEQRPTFPEKSWSIGPRMDLEIQEYGAPIYNMYDMYRRSMWLFGVWTSMEEMEHFLSVLNTQHMWMARVCEDTPQKDAYQQWQLVTWLKCSRFVTRSPWWIFSKIFEPTVTCITYLFILIRSTIQST